MINEERLLNILYSTHISEKASNQIKKYNTLILKVNKKANKKEIKSAVKIIFNIKVKNVCTLITKGKKKRYKQIKFKRKNWKKAYIILEKDQNLDFIDNT